jgi:hypothetical protein
MEGYSMTRRGRGDRHGWSVQAREVKDRKKEEGKKEMSDMVCATSEAPFLPFDQLWLISAILDFSPLFVLCPSVSFIHSTVFPAFPFGHTGVREEDDMSKERSLMPYMRGYVGKQQWISSSDRGSCTGFNLLASLYPLFLEQIPKLPYFDWIYTVTNGDERM